ncbi:MULTISPECIES: tetraacyldisaccharide 4'-kinase [Bradyrhizobium]|jgi:tetraacyldisaccharide 4'-kinase|uniref:tetraacyldisaccharide 4'-kinase n=3 Tax=Nitrobacteraceae TaxID=41294 RepID=UPI0003A812BF|nr:tetraacyldisaccharide 4'-kinase [Bradyrhizobium denitrificans]MCL8485743.1 tetraacyldisaccharide 4'-kinase [Bradyrhizobium denitrificans]RTL92433.1 MAG: tetraacyldisaccharide 4'-kinase [Bradyrhizobiaceae bacterium]
MREPAFWHRPHAWQSLLLSPLSVLYGAIAAHRMAQSGLDAGVPVICVGNFHVGGAGKTPTVLALSVLLRELGEHPVVLSRGYGGRLAGPVAVDPAIHAAADVGDEPLMMAAHVPVVVSRHRAEGVGLAKTQGASVILMDDGFQNPSLTKDLALIVIDGARGLGNGRVFPAGPLRAPLPPQLARTDALIVVGSGAAGEAVAARVTAAGKPVFRAHLQPDTEVVAALAGRPLLAFAGIGDPQRFFRTLRASGLDVVGERAFPDHHPFSTDEIAALADKARHQGATLVTTQKDLARLRGHRILGRSDPVITAFPVTLQFSDPTALRSLVAHRLASARQRQPFALSAPG